MLFRILIAFSYTPNEIAITEPDTPGIILPSPISNPLNIKISPINYII